ncbi:hypothetical protein DNU06_09150 [Putridiphycobacter roseus]|uniref:Uncharacterized protein n=1 Tax=Putridiphycobacter roseus TaxID=2219161 RepID=A0A2W1MZS3_9FLAO|nr:hypothetical protein [Putridiphycobacter roseus]PZE17427.1 hypothetical protein DNU06_09150 [Putridiphycobacter roseus]
MQNTVFLFFVFLCSVAGYSQTESSQNQFLSVSLTGIYFNKLQIYDKIGFEVLSKRLPTGEFGVTYTNLFRKTNGIQFNFNTGIFPINIGHDIKTPANSIFNTGPYKEDYVNLYASNNVYIQVYSSIGIMAVKQFSIFENKRTLDFNYGVSFFKMWNETREFGFTSIYEIDDNNSNVELFKAFLVDSVSNEFLASLRLELKSRYKFTKNSISYGIVLNYSPFTILEGWYNLANLNTPSKGKLKQKMNYLGFNISYDLNN